MVSSVLSIGQTALAAAQAGLATTSHNIANANTPGYSRQIVLQGPANAQDTGVGFFGKGTEVVSVRRVYNEFLATQVLTSQTSKSGLDSYYNQIRQIDNMLADSTSGISPTLQDFFSGVQGLTTNPDSTVSRQTVLSSAEALASRFQNLSGRLSEMKDGFNNELTETVSFINTYSQQIARLNESIKKAYSTGGTDKAPNDLLDQRDYLVSEMSKQVKVSVVSQGNSYNVFIGNGQPVVIGDSTYELSIANSPTDPSRLTVAYTSNGNRTLLPETGLTGGRLGGLLDFRNKTLDQAQNGLGRIAVGLAMTFNAQHRLGTDQNGTPGGAFFNVAGPVVSVGSNNNRTSNGQIGATITNPSALTTSDYLLEAGPTTGAYRITRIADGAITPFTGFPVTVDGVQFNLASGSTTIGDRFLVQPTIAGASSLSVAISATSRIAAAGAPSAGPADNRNALALGRLQTSPTLGSDTYQSAFGQLVSQVGNKTRELEVTRTAESKMLAAAVAAQQSESGVNLDEEAANLLRYQQAYQAAGKVMQTASQLFDVLLSLGR